MTSICAREPEAAAPIQSRKPASKRDAAAAEPAARFDVGNVDVDLLLFFHAVGECLSFTRAAHQLGIDQSWLSHKIRKLEDALGVKLFIRNTRNVELTEAGCVLLDPVRRLAEVAQQARDATKMLQEGISGTLRIGALPFSFVDRQRTALIDRFMASQPATQVVVVNGPTPTLVDHVKSGKVHMAFVSAPFDEDGLDMMVLRENSYGLLMSTDHPLARLDTIAPEDLKGQKVVIPSEHFSPGAFNIYYRPVIECGIVPVAVPEFQSAISYAKQWRLPVVCTRHSAERDMGPDQTIRPLDFIPTCKKYLIRLQNARTPSQIMLWEMAAESVGALKQAA